MVPQLRSGSGRSSGPEPPGLSADSTTYQPLSFIPSESTPSEPVIIRQKSRLPGLLSAYLKTLRQKQSRLKRSVSLVQETARKFGEQALKALASTLIFAQHEAGTAVCIDARGWILTCAHCFGETTPEWQAQRHQWLLYYTGLAVQVECRARDAHRDLALAKIVRVELLGEHGGDPVTPRFEFVSLAASQCPKSSIICIGQPGVDDLESESPQKTSYNLVEISQGRLCGMIPDVDPQDNSNIGVLKHNAWTYWGHSGAPLLCECDGTLLGLHSSWDDTTAMRHGVPLIAIKAFLKENLALSEVVDLTEPTSTKRRTHKVIVVDSSE